MTLLALSLARLGKLGRKAFDLFLGIPLLLFPFEGYEINVSEADRKLFRLASP